MPVTIEDVYEEIGGMGRFQITAVSYLSTCLFTIGWSMLQMTFAGALPEFTCVNNMTTGPYTNWTMNACSVNSSSCAAYEYHTSLRTVITEWDLVCDFQWTKKVIITIQMVGVLIGAAVCGQLGDQFGRKKVLYSFASSHVVLNIIAAFSSSWIMFACFRFLIGVCIGAIILIVIPYILEFLPIKWRPLIGVIPAWAIGVAFFALAAFLLNDWSYLHISCGMLSMPCLLGYIFVPESVRWLTVRGRLEEAENVIRRIARTNKKDVRSDIRSVLRRIHEEESSFKEKTKNYNYIDLFRRWRTARISIILFYTYLSMAVMYYGISFGIASLTGNLYVNTFLLGIMEIPFQLSTFFFNNRIGRHKSAFMFLTLSFFPVFGCLSFHLFSSSDAVKGLAINVLSLFAKMMIGCSWYVVQVWGNESFPTVMRSLGCGFQAIGARIGGILAPLIVDLDTRMAESYAIMSAMILLALMLSFVVPETKGKTLNDHVRQQQGDIDIKEKIQTTHSDGNSALLENDRTNVSTI